MKDHNESSVSHAGNRARGRIDLDSDLKKSIQATGKKLRIAGFKTFPESEAFAVARSLFAL
jgi:hypothetical protein